MEFSQTIWRLHRLILVHSLRQTILCEPGSVAKEKDSVAPDTALNGGACDVHAGKTQAA